MSTRSMTRRFVLIVLVAALALPALWGCASPRATVVRVGPPAPRVEVRTVRPGPGYAWIGGHWRWNGRRYVWGHGRWVRRPHGHAVWISGHWKRHGGGWIWISGHWRS